MARSKRRRRSSGHGRPARFTDGNAIPPELLRLTPPERAVAYLGGRDHVRSIALQIFGELPTLGHAVLVTDVLGGVHGVRCFEMERGLRLSEVADLLVMDVEDLPFAAHLIYLSRGAGVPVDASKQWNTMRFLHAGPPHLVDVLIVSPDHERVSSLADRCATERAGPQNN